MVVEVVLAGDRGTFGRENPAQRVTHGSPPRATEVDRTGRVGRDELEVHPEPVEGRAGPVRRTTFDHSGDHHVLRVGGESDVHEPGSGDLGGGDALTAGELGGKPSCQLTRVDADLLTELERNVGGVVAVLGIARPFHDNTLRQRGRVESVVGEDG